MADARPATPRRSLPPFLLLAARDCTVTCLSTRRRRAVVGTAGGAPNGDDWEEGATLDICRKSHCRIFATKEK